MKYSADKNFLINFNGVQSRSIFCFWTGDEIMSTDRLHSLLTIFFKSGCNVNIVTKETLGHWIHPHHNLHCAYNYLSSVHKSDYLRSYFMHYYGGGYCDIKSINNNWLSFFASLECSNKLALGYQELENGVAPLNKTNNNIENKSHADLIGVCAFIFKKNTDLTYSWLNKTEKFLDAKLDFLIENPAQHPLDQKDVILPDGSRFLNAV